jgi:hypothetical protein
VYGIMNSSLENIIGDENLILWREDFKGKLKGI